MNRLVSTLLLSLMLLGLTSCMKQDAEACFSLNTSACLPGNCSVGFNAFCSEGEIDAYEWDFGDGSEGAGATPSHLYAKPGSYTVTLSVFGPNIHSATTTRTVIVPDSVNVKACFEVDSTSCETGTCTAYFDRNCSELGDTYLWDFGDGTTFSQDAHTASRVAYDYDRPGTYTVTLIAISNVGISDTATQSLTLTAAGNPGPNPNPTPTPSQAIARGTLDSITCNNTSCLAHFNATCSQGAQEYLWDFGDGTTGTGLYTTHRYPAAGMYQIRLFAFDQNGDPDDTTFMINVPNPLPGIHPTACFTVDSSNCQPGNCVYEFDASCSQDGQDYTWDLGDGNIATGPAIAHAYGAPGTYPVTLFVVSQDNLIDETTITIRVSSGPFQPPTKPEACFSIDFAACDSANCALALDAGCSRDVTAYLWDFGDGTTGGNAFVVHNYSTKGPVDITLTVFDSFNQTDDTTITVIIP